MSDTDPNTPPVPTPERPALYLLGEASPEDWATFEASDPDPATLFLWSEWSGQCDSYGVVGLTKDTTPRALLEAIKEYARLPGAECGATWQEVGGEDTRWGGFGDNDDTMVIYTTSQADRSKHLVVVPYRGQTMAELLEDGGLTPIWGTGEGGAIGPDANVGEA